jgi:hypothetical protein
MCVHGWIHSLRKQKNMNEFNSRIAAQRQILQLVNGAKREDEELFGLSSKAIDRWISANRIDPKSQLVELIRIVSDRLFFLANKSQEQVSEEYQTVSQEIALLATSIEQELGSRTL